MTVERHPAPAGRAVLESVVVPADAPRVRLDRAATTWLDAFPTRASARKAALRGELALDGEVSEPARWVTPGSRISWLEPPAHRVPVLRVSVPVVFEDDHLAVVGKPGGLATSGALPRTLERALPHNLTPSAAPDRLVRPRPVHRLDAPTAGLVVVAKTRSAHAHLGWQFQRRQIEKRYRAVVVGLLEGKGIIEADIEGRAARTRYVAREAGRSLHGGWITRVDVYPETGRTHQIRRHLASLGTPVLGDARYGREGLILRRKGLFLFAVALRLRHPQDERVIHVRRPEPPKVTALFAREARRWETWQLRAGPREAPGPRD